jgi:hypothetical protein
VTSSEARPGLDVRRAKHLSLFHDIDHVRGEAGDAGQDEIADLLAPVRPVTLGQPIGGVLREDAHGVLAVWRDRGVVGGLEVQLAPRRARHAATARGAGRLGVVDAGADRHHGAKRRVVGGRHESWQSDQSAVHLHHRAVDPPFLEAPAIVPRNIARAQGQGPLGIGVRHHCVGADCLAPFEHDALARYDGGHRDPGRHDRSRRPRCVGQGERHTAHATANVTPGSALAVQGPRRVHGVDGRGPGVTGTGVGADDPLTVEGGPQPRVLHVPLEDVGDRGTEHHVDGFSITSEARHHVLLRWCVAQPRVANRMGGPQHPPKAGEEILVGEVPVDIAR